MFTNLRIIYADGTKQHLNTEPMGRNMARELMLFLFYQQSGEQGADEIVSVTLFPQGKGKPLGISRSAL